MKIKDYEEAAQKELEQEDGEMVKEEIKERLREIKATENILAKLKKKYQDFLDVDADELL